MAYVVLLFLVLLPGYFFIKSIRKQEKRVMYLMIGSFLCLPLLVIMSHETGYQLLQKDVTLVSTELFEKNYGIPKDEILVIEPAAARLKHNINMEITTKKDFATWQERVKKESAFLTGEKIPSEKINEVITQIENCEITYSSSYALDSQTDYLFPYSKMKYKKNNKKNKGVNTFVSTGKNNLPEVIRLSKRQEETARRLTDFYAYPPSTKEVVNILDNAKIKENQYVLDD